MEFRNHEQQHPYYPRTLRLINYVPNQIPMQTLLIIVGSSMGLLMTCSFILARTQTKNPNSNALRFTWFILCGVLHCGFEAYWIYHHKTIAERSDLLAELWKEYSHGDSRYLCSDPLLLSLETITVVCFCFT